MYNIILFKRVSVFFARYVGNEKLFASLKYFDMGPQINLVPFHLSIC